MKRNLYLAAAAVLVLSCGTQAGAQGRPSEFLRCDGYGTPTRGGDAMTHGAEGGFMSNARSSRELRRQPPTLGASGIEACTVALADPRLLPEENIRRASLLHARALHRLAVGGDATAALEDLAAAERAAAGGGALIERSFGLAMRLTRAFALLKAGRTEESAAISAGVAADRPFEPALAFAAARMHLDATRDWRAYVARVRALAAVDPGMITNLFALAIARGEYADAIALHPQIVMSMPRARGGYEIIGVHDLAAEQVARRAWLDGAFAYALEAQGERAGADAALAAARAELDAALAPPPMRADGRRPGRQQRERHAAVERRGREAIASPAGWERHVRLRRLAGAGEVDEVLAELRRLPVPPDTAAIDLFEEIGRARPAMRDELAPMLRSLREQVYLGIDRAMAFGARDLLERLPEPESPQRLPAYDPAGGFRITARDGYRTRSGPLQGVQTVRFSSARGSIAIASEMALLRSAQLARDTGRRGMIVIARRGVVRTLSTTGFGGVPMQVPTGQEVEMDVLFVDPANLPPDYAEAGWRVLDPDAIWAALSPIYSTPAATAAP